MNSTMCFQLLIWCKATSTTPLQPHRIEPNMTFFVNFIVVIMAKRPQQAAVLQESLRVR
jgi:hypothetical protein